MNIISSRLVLLIAILVISCTTNKKEGTPEGTPNVIIIMVDDMGIECLSSYGSLSYSTPNLDKMAKEGIRFTHCYSQPLCTPSRVKIMTGKYNYRNYEAFGYLNPNQKTFGNLMKEAGYVTCIAGKWQLNGLSGGIENQKEGWEDASRPVHFGFDEYCLWQLANKVYSSDGIIRERYKSPFIEQNGKILENTSGKYGPDVFCDFVCDFIERKKDEPFFVYYPMVLVHDPFVPTPDSPLWDNESEHLKNQPKHFADMVTYTDKLVGKIQNKLKQLTLADNTVLIFTGDNGTDRKITTNILHGTIRGEKGMMTDAGTRVPLLISWPDGIAEHTVCDELIGFCDFYSTFAELTGSNEKQDGKSILPILKGEDYEPRQTLTIHYDPMWGNNSNYRGRFVRDKRYKLYNDGRFYDLASDPHEKNPKDTSTLGTKEKAIWQKLNDEHGRHPAWK